MLSKTSSFKAINTLQSRPLNQLQHKINAQYHLTKRVKTLLPEPLAEQVLHCISKDNTLILYTHSAVWASQLRFYSRTITDSLTREQITTLHIKVIQKPSFSNTPKRKPNIPSTEKIEFLKTYSDTVQDGQLKTALLKLSNTLTQLSHRNR